ncbi:hypothetical protein OPU71_04495 [Niveibacterium sp. 24ML]|uniref:DUF4124 domain-containing protein n=1 Tax=Niveibacterium sp. 24ML TaxID=2985512 RepID=UPI00226F6CDD|nr:hypothetical protein [Niveibacterium sp. 24ML]MCX9155377.1 hypothetical protein [Niveibacterium sp. 24ML]
MRIFLILFVLTGAAVVGLYSLVHGEPSPQLKAAASRATPDLSRLPDPRDVIEIEPAQPPGAGIHKCTKRGKVVYTDQPCPEDHKQGKLDPERSQIVTLPADKPASGTASAAPAKPVAGGIEIAEDGSIRRAQ